MSSTAVIPCNDTTPTEIFSGEGLVFVKGSNGTSDSGALVVGGPTVTYATGFNPGQNNMPPFRINSPDKLYAICAPGQSLNAVVLHLR